MISKDKIVELVEEQLTDEQFIVSIDVSSTNHISVTLDSFSGLTIKNCMEFSRHIEGNLDRETEDFELQVSSAGLGEPFKIHKQFLKNKGKDVEVVMADGIKLEGTLKEVDEDGFELETRKREKVEGHKKKQLIVRVHRIEFDKAKTVKNIIKF